MGGNGITYTDPRDLHVAMWHSTKLSTISDKKVTSQITAWRRLQVQCCIRPDIAISAGATSSGLSLNSAPGCSVIFPTLGLSAKLSEVLCEVRSS